MRTRDVLAALGIAIGIASMVSVLGISASGRASLLATIDRLGTNLLTVEPGQSFFGEDAVLSEHAVAKVGALPGVRSVGATYAVDGATVRRSRYVDAADTSGISVLAADRSLARTLSASLAAGTFLTAAGERYPTVVLGSIAAQRLGLPSIQGSPLVRLGGRDFQVAGILRSVTLDESIDRAALIGLPAARRLFDIGADPTRLYLRADPSALTDVRALLGATVSPEHPEEVAVSRPSDALEARAAAQGAFTSLLLGLGAVALLVGGVGIANVMVISVLERRPEIGLRRALGATRRDISAQFLRESLLLAALGGVAGSVLGALVTVVSSLAQGDPLVVPPEALAGGVAAALVIGALAGLYPSVRAARLAPADALRTI